jgi:hypothetical protein
MKTRMKSWVPRDADIGAIKSAYRKLTMKYHRQNPDDAVAATADSRKYRKLMKLSRKNLIQKTCLAGVSFDPSMFAQMFRTQYTS